MPNSFWKITPRWYKRHLLAYQLVDLTHKVGKLSNIHTGNTKVISSKVVQLIQECLKNNFNDLLLESVQLMKAVVGIGVAGEWEISLVGTIVLVCTEKAETDAASYALDAYKVLIKQAKGKQSNFILKQLNVLAAVTYKTKNFYLLSRTVEYLFLLAEQKKQEQKIIQESLRGIKLAGLLAIKIDDFAMLQEIGLRIISNKSIYDCCVFQVAEVIISWINMAAKQENAEAVLAIANWIALLQMEKFFSLQDTEFLLKEGEDIACMVCLNPYSKIGPLVLEQLLKLAYATYDIRIWRKAVLGCFQVQRIVLSHYVLKDCFKVILPSLVCGRKLFSLVTKVGNDYQGFRVQSLFFLMRELLQLAEFAAKRDMVITTGDVIEEIFMYWQRSETIGHRVTKRFCQFMLMYWSNTRRKAKKILPVLSKELTEPNLLTYKDHNLFTL